MFIIPFKQPAGHGGENMATAIQEASQSHSENGEQQKTPRMVDDVVGVLKDFGVKVLQEHTDKEYILRWYNSSSRFVLTVGENEGKADSLSIIKKPADFGPEMEEVTVSGIETAHASKTKDPLDLKDRLSLTLRLGPEETIVQKIAINPVDGSIKTRTFPKNS